VISFLLVVVCRLKRIIVIFLALKMNEESSQNTVLSVLSVEFRHAMKHVCKL